MVARSIESEVDGIDIKVGCNYKEDYFYFEIHSNNIDVKTHLTKAVFQKLKDNMNYILKKE